jgi:hypothetical protein
MGCANVPGNPTPPRESRGPTTSATNRAPSTDARGAARNDQPTVADIRAALQRVGALNAQNRAKVERVLKQFEESRGVGPNYIEVSDKGHTRDGPRTSSRGNPVINFYTLLHNSDRNFQAETQQGQRWTEVKGSRVLSRPETRHGHRDAEVIVVSRNGKDTLYLSIPRTESDHQALFGWPGRSEGPRNSSDTRSH